MKQEKINEVTINYWIGGISPLLLLMPFLLEFLNDLYYAFYHISLSTLEISIVFSFAVFLFTSIVVYSSIRKLKGQKEGCFGFIYFFYFSSVYLLFEGYYLGRIFHANIVLSIIVGLMMAIISLILHFRFKKNIFEK